MSSSVNSNVTVCPAVDPESMTVEERRREVVGILSRGLLRWAGAACQTGVGCQASGGRRGRGLPGGDWRAKNGDSGTKNGGSWAGKIVSKTSQNCLEVMAETRLSVSQRPAG